MTKRLILLLVLFLSMTACEAQRTTNWKEDMDFWKAEVKKQHYVYRAKDLPAGFDARFENIKTHIPEYSDQRMVIEILGLAAMLGDGHNYVIPWTAQGFATMALPLRLYLFNDGLFVIDAYAGYESWIGKKVIRIGNVSAEELMKRVDPFIGRDSDQGVVWIGPVMLSLEGMLQALGVDGKGAYQVDFSDSGKKVSKTFDVVPFQPVRGIPKLIPQKTGSKTIPLYLQHVRETFWISSLKKESTLYAQFNQVMNDPRESLAGFAKRLSDSLDVVKPKKLIIDVRHNNGGNADLLGPLLEVLQRYRSSPSTQLFILTGRNTFSACQIFISKADRLVKPIFAGEESSSKPNFVGEENVVFLPHSKAMCSISNRYHESIPGDTRRVIEPQMKITLSSADYFSGKDPVLEAVLRR